MPIFDSSRSIWRKQSISCPGLFIGEMAFINKNMVIHYQNCYEKRDINLHNVNGFNVDAIPKKLHSPKWEKEGGAIVIEYKIKSVVVTIMKLLW